MEIVVTDKAKEKLEELLTEQKTDKSLRLYIASYGWGGPSFGMALEEPTDTDSKYTVDGFNFILEEGFDQVYGKFTIGYSDSFLRKGFTVTPDRGGSNC